MKFSVVTPLWQDRPPGENLEIAKLADALGYPELWVGEMATYDEICLVPATAGDPSGRRSLEAMSALLR